MEFGQARRREQIENKLKQEEAQKKEDQRRMAKQNRLKPELQSMLGSAGKSADQLIKEKSEAFKAGCLAQEQETKKVIAMAIQNGRDRPMLLDSYNQKAKIEHERDMAAVKRLLIVLVESGLKEHEALQHLTKEEMVLW